MTDGLLEDAERSPPKSPLSPTNDRVGKVVPFRERLSCTVDEACTVTGLGRTKLYELIGSGQLVTTTIGRRRLVIVQSLLQLVDTTISA
ncbi:helix-turn-helix domain-containing protein [Bradyrhizobium japonicum]|uniref:helix-turn-helix domain-containing protein n=1 Tax=Bradyrhizobium japonicum TaxID=375 RepID=UPI001BA7D01B|nr:helix-turn-helix domain-containing protein [Bradyrhizobium japonicum]